MKICCIADLHIGVKSYSKIDPVTHFYHRELEVLQNFKKIIDMCLNTNIPILVIAGDIYHTSLSSPTLQDEVNKILFYASSQGLQLVILAGNHDLPKINTAVSAIKPVDTFQLPNITYTSNFMTKEVTIGDETVKFVFLATYTNNEEIKQYLDLVLPLNEKKKEINIVIGHLTMQGSQLNDWLVAENEEYIDIHHFDNRNIDYVVLGHLHKPQVLSENPFIFYTGSLQRGDFNEEDQEKGYWIIDTNSETKFYPIDTQNFYTLKLAVTDEIIETNVVNFIKKKIDKKKVKNAIVRIILDIPEYLLLSSSEEKDIQKYLESLQAYSILTIKQKVADTKRVRNVEFNELLSIDKALEIYYKDKPRGEERIQLGKNLVNEYRSKL